MGNVFDHRDVSDQIVSSVTLSRVTEPSSPRFKGQESTEKQYLHIITLITLAQISTPPLTDSVFVVIFAAKLHKYASDVCVCISVSLCPLSHSVSLCFTRH